MGSIQRHLIAEVLRVFLLTAAICLLLLTLGGGAKEGIRRGLPLPLVLQTMPYFIPEMLRFTIPGCLLFAVCSVFGRLSASNELIAIKSQGIHPLAVVWPVLILAAVLSLVTTGLYDLCANWSRPGLQRVLTTSIDRIAYRYLQANGAYATGGLSIVVRGVDEQQLLQPVITMARPDSKQKVTLTAKAASLSMDRSGHWLRIECSDGCVEMEGVGTYSFPETFVHDVPLVEPRPDRENAASPAALAATSIPWQVARERSLIRHLESQTADADSHLEPDTKRLGEIERHRRRLLRLRAEIPRRMSNGFACMCFAMIGIPISLRARTLDTMSTFFICFAPVMLVYYPLLVIGENLARGGILPELSVWLADAVLLAVGCLFLHRVARN